jgi:hypothetical protein
MKKDNKNIELVVFNCFIRVIKSDGKYMLFRRSVTNNGIMKVLIKNQTRRSDCPFSTSTCTEDIVKTLEKITNEMARGNGKKGGIKDLDKYEHVTMTINHLLHFFMEANGVSMDKLCSLGEEIYSLSCNKLFGDTMEDLERHNEEEIKNISDLGQLKAKLFQNYIQGIQNGQISHKVSFDDYLKQHSDELKKFSDRKIDNDSMGQALGRVPDDNEFLGELRHGGRAPWLDDIEELIGNLDDGEGHG